MANLRSVLHAWRDNEASKKGIELFRVLPSSAIDEIVQKLPKTKEELTAIKGIKDAKFTQYGSAILNMVKASLCAPELPSVALGSMEKEGDAFFPLSELLPKQKDERMLYSVSAYLDIINRELWRVRATIKGEVTSFKEQGKAVYFSVRDSKDGSTLSVFMWLSDFALAGILLTEGLEVILEGRSEIYKPSGRFSFRAETIELAGEGAFQKAYNELKKKLELEGLFLPEKKRQLKEHPVRIGLITSRTGAVIHDFLSNLGKFGYQVTFVDTRVEGAGAVKDILSALTHLETMDIDVLVLIRGGGSLESLQAFNNELIVRKVAEFPAVTICAIGHDKDVPLVQLVADYAPSTPTATTLILNYSWQEAIHELRTHSHELMSQYQKHIRLVHDEGEHLRTTLEGALEILLRPFRRLLSDQSESLVLLARQLSTTKDELVYARKTILDYYRQQLKYLQDALLATSRLLSQHDPNRQLRLGYSILTIGDQVIRSISEVKVGERFEARLSDGTLESEVIKTTHRE